MAPVHVMAIQELNYIHAKMSQVFTSVGKKLDSFIKIISDGEKRI